MFARNGLLRFLLADIVGFGGDQGDKFDTTFDQEVSRIFGERLPRGGGKDFGYDLLDRRWAGR
jgi:hypothetical protein